MKRQHVMIDSPSMGRKMHVWSFGHWGAPVLVFPTAAGFAHEWERQGMVETLAPLIYGGKIKLYCPESNVSEAWTQRDSDPEWRIQRHKAYEEFVVSTLVPAIRADCNAPQIKIGTTGASLGAFYAANVALKYPEIFHYALCMSGRYDMSHFAEGHDNLDVYFNNPLAYVGRLGGESLERIRRHTHLTLVCGQGMWEEGCIEETHALANLLDAKQISHHRDIWGHDVSHDWIWWKRQAYYHLGRTFG